MAKKKPQERGEKDAQWEGRSAPREGRDAKQEGQAPDSAGAAPPLEQPEQEKDDVGASEPPVRLTNKEQRMARKAEKQAALESKKRGRERNQAENGDYAAGASADAEGEHAQEAGDTSYDDGRVVSFAADDEEAPLSHKEQRKRRKLEKRASDSADHAEEEEEAPKRPQRSPFSLWVGNLSFRTTAEELQDFLRENGVSGISRVHMPKGARRGEDNRGFAYVDVPSPEQVNVGVGLSESTLNGRQLLIKDGSDFRGRPSLDPSLAVLGARGNASGKTGLSKTAQKILMAQKHPAGPTLFFGNLSFETTEEEIQHLLNDAAARRHLEAARENGEEIAPEEAATAGIRRIRMGAFEDTGKCKGFAFIDFESTAKATAALLEPRNGRLLGRELIREYAGVDAIRRGASKDQLPEHLRKPTRRGRWGRAPHAPAEEDYGAEDTGIAEEEAPAGDAPAAHGAPPRRTDGWGRARPGAANANAPRQGASIVPAQGRRTTFDEP